MIAPFADGKNSTPVLPFLYAPIDLEQGHNLFNKGAGLIQKANKKRVKKILAVCIFITLIIIILLCLRYCGKSEPPPAIGDESKPALEFVPAGDVSGESVTMPGYQGLIFQSGETAQKTDLYNPEGNKCLFVFSLYLSDETLLFKSDFINPGEKLTDITINQTLQKGTYPNCKLVIDCFSLDTSKQLNGSIQTIYIKTQ